MEEKLNKEISLWRIAGPFYSSLFVNFRISLLGIIPKKEPNEYRLIQHLSYPYGSSFNDRIDPLLTSVSYASFEAAISKILAFATRVLPIGIFFLIPVLPCLGFKKNFLSRLITEQDNGRHVSLVEFSWALLWEHYMVKRIHNNRSVLPYYWCDRVYRFCSYMAKTLVCRSLAKGVEL